jgi:hypothetical protein
MLFCSRCRHEKLTDQDRAFHWRISSLELADTKKAFLEKGFIDDNWDLLNWNRRQFISDSSTERVRRYRQGLKRDETLHETKRNVTVTAPDTDTEAETEKKQKKTTPQSGFVLPPWIDPEIWTTYLEVRSSKRAAKTPRAWGAVVKQLERFKLEGHDPNAILETSIRSNWIDVYPPKLNGGNGNGAHKPHIYETGFQKAQRELKEQIALAEAEEQANGSGGVPGGQAAV